jgi:DNA-binding transcriptional regulator YiaG
MQEIWKDIPEYEGIYQVSNLGNLKSYDRIVFFNKVKALRKGKILSLRQNKDGYLYTNISVDKKRKTIKPHRIVAKVFIQNIEKKTCVNHINGIKNDNRVENLEWVTHSENTKHAVKIGLKKGKRNGTSHFCKLDKKQVEEIRNIYLKGNISQLNLAKLFNISQSQVSRILRKENWT